MTSWGGTSMVTVLRSILTILSTTGRRIKSPGPFGPPCTLPSLKITPRSYSLTILMALSMTETMTIATITTTIAANPIPTVCNKPKVAYTRDPPLSWPAEIPSATGHLEGHYLHYPSLTETYNPDPAPHPYNGLIIQRIGLLWGERQHGPPTLTVHEDPPWRVSPYGALYGADLADHSLLAGKSRLASERAQRT